MKTKKLIEVALPIKEISAESVRDKSIRHGHISTLHLWWARRPLPTCRAVVFASLVPDPLDENCPQAFVDAVKALLDDDHNGIKHIQYKPYEDIPYTAIDDPMEDNPRHRLMMFIGKFSDKCSNNMMKGESTPPKEQLSDGSLIKWENKNNPEILRIARELIFVAYNADKMSEATYQELHKQFDRLFEAIIEAETALYSIPNRHIASAEVSAAETRLKDAIEQFQNNMPSVFDPFAGGGAIPLEAARLGCRSFGNDINPVAHIIEKGSAEFPQKYGKPITYTKEEFLRLYGEEGKSLLAEKSIAFGETIEVPNRLSFDVEYYAKKLIYLTKQKTNCVYGVASDCDNIERPSVYYWTKFLKCSNSSCQKSIPLFKQYYLSKPRANKKIERIKHFFINTSSCDIEIRNGETKEIPTVARGILRCPFCGALTDINGVKQQFIDKTYTENLIACIYESPNGKIFKLPLDSQKKVYTLLPEVEYPEGKLHPNSAGGDILSWGFTKWGELFNKRQLYVVSEFCNSLKRIIIDLDNSEYNRIIHTYLAILIDRIAVRMTSFGKWHMLQDTVEHLFGRQAIQINFDYPELDPFSKISSSATGQLGAILAYIEEESCGNFISNVENISSGDHLLFGEKELSAVITDPPYYDAIAYADISDFFYVWLKKMLGDFYPMIFATPQTPKAEECTALKHHHNNDAIAAKSHFENKLTQIFDAIENQTSDIVSIMFAHQSTEAWTTLCNSILGARMNITGSWPMDTEMQGALKADKAFLESSVTVACRPSERNGFAEYKDVKRDIERKVEEEIEKLYELGFRGADLLTACFGQAVSEFGKYESVEKSNGDEVTVAELLDMARQTAFDTLLKGVQGDEFTRFYIGWLQMNGAGDADYDDATKFTRVGVNVEIKDVVQERLLIQQNNKYHLAMAHEHIGGSLVQGTLPTHSLIEQAHRLIITYKEGNRSLLLKLVRDLAHDAASPLWRLLAALKELLPANDDAKQVQGLLINAENLRQEASKPVSGAVQQKFDF